jgi:hypothetical protein
MDLLLAVFMLLYIFCPYNMTTDYRDSCIEEGLRRVWALSTRLSTVIE